MQKVLFITYFWPPSGKASLHWPLKMIKFLPEYGWQPTVLTVNEETFYQKDESLLKEIDPKLQVIKTGTLEPFNLYRKLLGKSKEEPLVASDSMAKNKKSLRHSLSLSIRLNLFIPDARVGWYFRGVKEGKKFLSENSIDIIITIGPPHSAHLLGRKLSSKFNIPHIPVFIDPWIDIVYYQDLKRNILAKSLDKMFEENVIKNARDIIFVTETMKNDYEKKYQFLKEKSHVLYWGYDEDDFSDIEKETKVYDREAEIITHAGNMYDYHSMTFFWEKIRKEIDEGRNIKLRFIGTVSPGISAELKKSGLLNKTEYLGFLEYKDMLKELLKSDILMMLITEKRHVPGKLFEYLRTGKSILAFGNDNEEVKNILKESNAGMIFNYNEDISSFLDKNEYKKFKTDFSLVQKFNRKNIAKELSRILYKTLEKKFHS